MRLVITEDLTAAKLGLEASLGLLYPAGAIVDDVLPDVETKLLAEGLALREEDWLLLQEPTKEDSTKSEPAKRATGGSQTKRGTGPQENK